jgi:hypothetical protein
MGAFVDITGMRYGRLTVLHREGSSNAGQAMWRCQCDCGGTVRSTGQSLREGGTRSCVCFQKDRVKECLSTHNMVNSRVYSTWKGILTRCYNKNVKAYSLYGGRGIQVCDKWKSFLAFFADVGEPPTGTSLDRINTDGNYEPGNVRWATPREQCNNKRNNTIIEYNGKKQTVANWARETGIEKSVLLYRIKTGWPIEQVLTESTFNTGKLKNKTRIEKDDK